MNELALFAGTGGGLLGSHLLGWIPICAVEKEPYCREVLLRRQRDGVLPLFPIWDDILTFDGSTWAGAVDIVTAGFPCQPWSVAGRRAGKSDDRDLWPDTIRVIREVGPRFALLENVPGLLANDYFGQILGDLEESGFDARWDCIPASAIGANHQRDRLWILAHPRCGDPSRIQPESEQGSRKSANTGGGGEDVANAESEGLSRSISSKHKERFTGPTVCSWWLSEPSMGRVAHGVAHRVDRLKALGNGQVPGVVKAFWGLIAEAEKEDTNGRTNS